jgi:pyrimidine deaminase RibD-like protein
MESDDDLKLMKEAIDWADACHPIKKSIPKVGAIIAVGDKVLGRGHRGTGRVGDDEHAEVKALENVEDNDKSMLSQATLYTTLEPCTKNVRSIPEKACAEQILQHQIKRVFVGILDPNQGVTGKGLWRLQDSGVEVILFPHELSKEVRIQNVDFIRAQQTLGATIVAPKDGEKLRTFFHTIRVTCVNPPGPDTYLLIYRQGLYWPQSGTFRQGEQKIWEIDAHFGSTGEHTLQLVTADSLGSALIRYYRKITEQNRTRRDKVRGKIDLALLVGSDYPGIEMNGLPKGLRLEASVKVIVAQEVNLIEVSVEPKAISRGSALKITYEIECSDNIPEGIWLGASIRDKTQQFFFNTSEDRPISLTKGRKSYNRKLTIARNVPQGEQMLQASVWRGTVGDSSKSKWIAGGRPIPIEVVD